MPELPQKKVGIIACSGEELPAGTVSRLAALKVLEELRPADTVTICLPLFLAGGEGDRAFAKFYPTIAVDGCEKRCAYRGTEKYSNQPAVSIVVSNILAQTDLEAPQGSRSLNQAGQKLSELVAEKIATQVDSLLGRKWNRSTGEFSHNTASDETSENKIAATCSCGSGIPPQDITIDGRRMTLLALPLIFENIYRDYKSPTPPALAKALEMVKIYNAVEPEQEPSLQAALASAFQEYCNNQEEHNL